MAGKEFFHSDNPFNEMLTRVFNLLELNLLWIIFSLPIITVGAATAALYTLCFRMLSNQETSIFKEFVRSFKENFRPSIPYTVTLLVTGTVLAADFHILGASGGSAQGILYGICLVLLVAFAAIFSYAFPLFARYENTFSGTMNNAWRLAASKIPQTLALLAIHCLPWILLLSVPDIFFHIFWIWIFAGVAVGAYLASMLLRPVFTGLG